MTGPPLPEAGWNLARRPHREQVAEKKSAKDAQFLTPRAGRGALARNVAMFDPTE